MAGNYTFKLTSIFNVDTIAATVPATQIGVYPVGYVPPLGVGSPTVASYVTDSSSPTSGTFRATSHLIDVIGGVGYAVSEAVAIITDPVSRKVYVASISSQLTLSTPTNPLTVTSQVGVVTGVVQGEQTFSGYVTVLPVNGGLQYVTTLYLTPN